MKIVIISDIHDNLENLGACLNWCQKNKIKEMICCGDTTTLETLKIIRERFSGVIHFALGNADIFSEKETVGLDNFNFYGKIGRAEIDNVNIGLCHEPYLIDKVLELGECSFVFYGHTHKPWIEERDGVNIVNPGTLGGMFQKSTFAVLDTKTKNLELKLTNTL